MVTRAQLELWAQKWRWYERNSLPWNRARIHWEVMRRGVFFRWPVHGNVLEALREGRLEIGREHPVRAGRVADSAGPGRIRIGEGRFLNLGVMVAALELVEIGRTACSPTAASSAMPTTGSMTRIRPVPWQGFTSTGPTRVGDNVWCGPGVVITSGVTVGERCVIGANSVVTRDIPAYSVAAGAPARVLRTIEYD